MSTVPYTRTLPYVLREALARPALSAIVAEVTAIPDAASVTVDIAGNTVTIPRLASYTAPVVGEPAYILAGPSLMIALGTVRL